jgi:hypothetical protein
VLKRAVLSTGGTHDKTALFSTRKKNSGKKFSFLFIEQIVSLCVSRNWIYQLVYSWHLILKAHFFCITDEANMRLRAQFNCTPPLRIKSQNLSHNLPELKKII